MSENLLPSLTAPYDMPESAVAHFADKGWVRLDGVLSAEEIAAYDRVIDEVAPKARFDNRPLEDRDTFGRAFLQLGNLRFLDLRVQAFYSSHRFGQIAGDLLRVGAVRGYHDQALYKEPGGGITPWHQGQFYWPIDSADTITMWLALHDIEPAMGVLQVASGSHRFGSLGDFHMSDESHAALGKMVHDMKLEVRAPESYRAGDAVFFRGWTFASETQNSTDEMRRVASMVYYADGARVARLDHPVRLLARDTFFAGVQPGDFAASPLTQVVWRRKVG